MSATEREPLLRVFGVREGDDWEDGGAEDPECALRAREQLLCRLSPLAAGERASAVRKSMLRTDWLRTHFRGDDGRFFGHFREAPIRFLPTYRIDKTTTARYDLAKKSHGRYPGYADRIMATDGELVLSSYRSWDVLGSDHLPVSVDVRLSGEDVRVMTYNCGGKDAALTNLWKHVRSAHGDRTLVLCLQEVERPSTRSSLVPRSVAEAFHAKVFLRCGDRIPYLQSRLSSFAQAIVVLAPRSAPPLRVDRVSACRSSNWLATKGWLHADVYMPRSQLPIRIYCMHAPFVDEATTRRFFVALERSVRRFRRDTLGAVPVVLAGDMNSRSVPAGLPYAKNVRPCFEPCASAKVG